MKTQIRPCTIKKIKRFLTILEDDGIVSVSETNEIISQLKHIADKGGPKPVIVPKLVDQKEAARMLGLGHSNFKKLEAQGAFPFKRKMVGSAVRFRNTDIIAYIMSNDG